MTGITEMNAYISIMINAIFTGLGVAIGTYIANNHIIKNTKKMMKRRVKLK